MSERGGERKLCTSIVLVHCWTRVLLFSTRVQHRIMTEQVLYLFHNTGLCDLRREGELVPSEIKTPRAPRAGGKYHRCRRCWQMVDPQINALDIPNLSYLMAILGQHSFLFLSFLFPFCPNGDLPNLSKCFKR